MLNKKLCIKKAGLNKIAILKTLIVGVSIEIINVATISILSAIYKVITSAIFCGRLAHPSANTVKDIKNPLKFFKILYKRHYIILYFVVVLLYKESRGIWG